DPARKRLGAQVVAAGPAGMEVARLEYGADHPQRALEVAIAAPEDERLPRGGLGESEQQSQRRRLAGAVRTQEAGHRALAKRERQRVDRGHRPEALGEGRHLDDVRSHASILAAAPVRRIGRGEHAAYSPRSIRVAPGIATFAL